MTSARLDRFVTLEGGEGAGKTTQLEALAAHLRGRGETVVTTREPGGSEGAEAVRGLLVEGSAQRWSVTGELFLLFAARRDHLERTVWPAHGSGAWVLCDRFWDSTRVYQGLVGGLDLETIDRLHTDWLGRFVPGLTLLFDLPVSIGLARAAPGRFEAKGRTFHERVRRGYLRLATAEPERFRIIDATLEPAKVTAAVVDAVDVYRRAGGGL